MHQHQIHNHHVLFLFYGRDFRQTKVLHSNPPLRFRVAIKNLLPRRLASDATHTQPGDTCSAARTTQYAGSCFPGPCAVSRVSLQDARPIERSVMARRVFCSPLCSATTNIPAQAPCSLFRLLVLKMPGLRNSQTTFLKKHLDCWRVGCTARPALRPRCPEWGKVVSQLTQACCPQTVRRCNSAGQRVVGARRVPACLMENKSLGFWCLRSTGPLKPADNPASNAS